MRISKRPTDAQLPAGGDWGPFLGKAAFYRLRYRNYLIGLNTTEAKTYSLKMPPGSTHAINLVTGVVVESSSEIAIPPLSTVVLCCQN